MFSTHDQQRLQGVHPLLIQRVGLLFVAMYDKHQLAVFIAQGVRTAAYQHSLWLQGRDPAHHGRIVTDKDGYTRLSNHQVRPQDGFGHAVDVAFLPTPAQRDAWAKSWPWGILGSEGKALGLIWGGDWKGTLVDLDHFELPS